jgi:nucleoside-diphosphate-sugar epimerase
MDFIRDVLAVKPFEIPGDGRALIPFVHREDLANSIRAVALGNPPPSEGSTTFPADAQCRVREYVRMVARLLCR